MQEGENRENKDYKGDKGNKGNKSFLVSLVSLVSPTLWRVHIAEGFLCQIRRWLHSLLGANEEATFEIWCKKHQRDVLAIPNRI